MGVYRATSGPWHSSFKVGLAAYTTRSKQEERAANIARRP
jgi:hypothetical protein